jgi:hypothetical protein
MGKKAVVKVDLKCPHGQAIEVKMQYGICLYIHTDDGLSCIVMNTMDIPVEEVLWHYTPQLDIDQPIAHTPLFRAVFLNSKPYRLEVYKRLATATLDTLPDLLVKINHVLQATRDDVANNIWQEATDLFGPVFVRNMLELSLPAPTTYGAQQSPMLPILDIAYERGQVARNTAFDDIDSAMSALDEEVQAGIAEVAANRPHPRRGQSSKYTATWPKK